MWHMKRALLDVGLNFQRYPDSKQAWEKYVFFLGSHNISCIPTKYFSAKIVLERSFLVDHSFEFN